MRLTNPRAHLLPATPPGTAPIRPEVLRAVESAQLVLSPPLLELSAWIVADTSRERELDLVAVE